MRIVLDTNVLVAGLLNPHGAPGRVLDAVLAGAHLLLLDDRIRAEYEEVLLRPRFGFSRADVKDLLQGLESSGESVAAPPLQVALPDPDDIVFLEVAVAGGAEALVTGNARHYQGAAESLKVRTVSPAEFLAASG